MPREVKDQHGASIEKLFQEVVHVGVALACKFFYLKHELTSALAHGIAHAQHARAWFEWPGTTEL